MITNIIRHMWDQIQSGRMEKVSVFSAALKKGKKVVLKTLIVAQNTLVICNVMNTLTTLPQKKGRRKKLF
jgi:hypothetical protein